MDWPRDEVKRECLRGFVNATNNTALKINVSHAEIISSPRSVTQYTFRYLTQYMLLKRAGILTTSNKASSV